MDPLCNVNVVDIGNSVMIKFIAPENRVIRFGSERVTEKVTEKEEDILTLPQKDAYRLGRFQRERALAY